MVPPSQEIPQGVVVIFWLHRFHDFAAFRCISLDEVCNAEREQLLARQGRRQQFRTLEADRSDSPRSPSPCGD